VFKIIVFAAVSGEHFKDNSYHGYLSFTTLVQLKRSARDQSYCGGLTRAGGAERPVRGRVTLLARDAVHQ
jgi:hypothetical protein